MYTGPGAFPKDRKSKLSLPDRLNGMLGRGRREAGQVRCSSGKGWAHSEARVSEVDSREVQRHPKGEVNRGRPRRWLTRGMKLPVKDVTQSSSWFPVSVTLDTKTQVGPTIEDRKEDGGTFVTPPLQGPAHSVRPRVLTGVLSL